MAIETREGQLDVRAADTAEVLAGLNDLLRLDHDALGAYEVATERLENGEHSGQIEGFKLDHERHIRDLNDVVLALGGTPVNEPHVTGRLKEAIQRIAGVGGDRALLTAWRANELQITTKYDRYARKAVSWPPDVKRVIDENALDEERHYQWAVDTLSGGKSPETHFANRLREGITVASALRSRARTRLGQTAAAARVQTADGLAGAAGRLERLADGQAGADGVRKDAAEGVHRVAKKLDTTAAYLRDGRGGVKGLIEDEIRSNPARSLTAMLMLGFVFGRRLR